MPESTSSPVPSSPGTAPVPTVPLTPAHPDLPAGPAEWPRIPGYEILSELGRGGMGVVYRAQQTALKRTVALKIILAGEHAVPAQLARFRIEAESLAQVR